MMLVHVRSSAFPTAVFAMGLTSYMPALGVDRYEDVLPGLFFVAALAVFRIPSLITTHFLISYTYDFR